MSMYSQPICWMCVKFKEDIQIGSMALGRGLCSTRMTWYDDGDSAGWVAGWLAAWLRRLRPLEMNWTLHYDVGAVVFSTAAHFMWSAQYIPMGWPFYFGDSGRMCGHNYCKPQHFDYRSDSGNNIIDDDDDAVVAAECTFTLADQVLSNPSHG